MKQLYLAILAAVLLVSTQGCRDDRNDETGRGEKQDRIDATRGTPPR